MKQWIAILHKKKNGKDNYIKMVRKKDCWSFQTKVINALLRPW